MHSSDFAEAARLSGERKLQLQAVAENLETRVLERTNELRNLSSRFDRVSMATDLGVWYCDLPFDELIWNDKTKEHFWMSPTARVKIGDFYEHIHPDDRERTRNAIAKSIEDHSAYDIEYRTIKPALPETVKIIRAIGWTDYADDGTPTRFDGITLDLTERKSQEKEKNLLQSDLQDLLERTSDGFFIVDSSWRVTYANPVTQGFFAFGGRSILGRTLDEIFPSSDHLKLMKRYENIVKTGESDRFEEIYEGHVLQVHAYRTREQGVAVFYRDVTEQVQANNKLKESEKRYATLTSAIPQLVWTCLPDGRCDYLSQQWANYTGVSIDQQLDLNWLDKVIFPEDRARTLEHWMGAVKGLHDYDIEYRIRRFDGEYRWFQTRGTPMRNDSGQIVYWVGTCTDIHNQKVLAEELNQARIEAERASEAKTQFLANMSHEIRTPIGAITGFTELLKSSSSTASDKQNYTMIIERNSKHLLRLIDDILDLSKVEAGKIIFENIDFSLPEFLRGFEAVMRLKSQEKGIEFVLKVKGLIPTSVCSDQLRLRQILANMAGNAVKFTDQGSVSVTVSYDDPVMKIDVTDTGVGISKENVTNLFQAFSQADPSLTRKFGGTGLGLILSRRLARLLGGDLILASTAPGKGSSFVASVVLPTTIDAEMIDFDGAVPAGPVVQKEEDVSLLRKMKVLLVEDSPDNQTLIKTYLRKTGAEVELADDGIDGIEKARIFRPDVILMDIQMPRMDGHEAMRILRDSGFTMPIIALTAHAMREERDRCFESGCTDYLTKPIDRNRLLEVLTKYVQ